MTPVNYQTESDHWLAELAQHGKTKAVRAAAAAEIARRQQARRHEDALLLAIARRHCVRGISTFEARGTDRDYREVTVWGLGEALREAFIAGRQTERGEATEPLDQFPPPRDGK